MAIKTALRKYTSMAAFEAEKAQLPFPSVCYIDDDGEKYVFFRNALSSIDDMLYHLGYEETPSQPDVPGSGGGEEPENPDTPDTPEIPDTPDEPAVTKKLSITGSDILGVYNTTYDFKFVMDGISGTPVLTGVPSWITVKDLDSSGFKLYVPANRSDDSTFTMTATLEGETATLEVTCHKLEIAIEGATYVEGKAGNTYDYTVSFSSNGFKVGTTWLDGFSAAIENLPAGVTATNVSLAGFTLSVASNIAEDVRQTVRYVVGGITGRLAIDFAHYSTTKDFGSNKRYIDLGLPSGTLWAPSNVGVPSSYVEQAGNFYAWGETNAKTSFSSSGYANDKIAALPLSKDVVNATYGGDWRMPTMDDVNELITYTDIEETTYFGANVIQFTSKVNGARLYIPCAGFYNAFGLNDTGTAYIWLNGASSRNIVAKLYAQGSDLNGFVTSYYNGWYGMNVRGVI